MKIFNKFKYISYRILTLWICVVVYFVIEIIYSIVLLTREQTLLFSVLGQMCVFALFISISFWKIYLPYKESEKLANRFLDGYDLSCDMPLLTPSTESQMKRMEEILHSPEVFDLNKRQAQYLALQNQINPHFLYNTLESIRSKALIANLDSVADMTEALAIFFRYTISKVENLVSVEEELENCKTYFHIQKYRFGNRIELHVEYEEDEWKEISRCRIPKLTLQPILENSIIHGTELKVGTSNLRIQFQCTEKRLLIRVSDDGVGMDEQALSKLNKGLRKSISKEYQKQDGKGGIALINVNNRIHLLFGEEYGMHVYSIQGSGTDVEISIPAISSDREVKDRGIFS